MLDPMIVPTFNPELYYTRQLRGNTHYPIYQSGRGLGSRLFSIVKSVGGLLLKDVILPTVKQEAGQVLKDITNGVGIKRALKQGAKRAGKSILKRGTQRIMQGKGRTRNIVRKRKREQNPSTALSMLLKSINSPKRTRF